MSSNRNQHGPCRVFACDGDTATHVVVETETRAPWLQRVLWTCELHAEMWRGDGPSRAGRVVTVRPLPAIEAAQVTA